MSMYVSCILASVGTSIITCCVMEWGANRKNRHRIHDFDGGLE